MVDARGNPLDVGHGDRGDQGGCGRGGRRGSRHGNHPAPIGVFLVPTHLPIPAQPLCRLHPLLLLLLLSLTRSFLSSTCSRPFLGLGRGLPRVATPARGLDVGVGDGEGLEFTDEVLVGLDVQFVRLP